jgi:hypothetical protein
MANTSQTLVTISPADWAEPKVVYVQAMDNFVNSAGEGFDVIMRNLGSGDGDFSRIIENRTFHFTKLDDVADSAALSSVLVEPL